MITIPISASILFAISVMALGLGIVFLAFFLNKKNRILRAFKKTKNTLISRVKENEYVKVIGKARHVKEPFIAPISGRKCILYQILVEQKNGNHGWSTIIEEERLADFFLESRSEMAIVKMEQPASFRDLFFEQDHIMSSGTFNDASAKLENYLKSKGKASTGILGFNKNLRYREGVIEINETIAVKGIGKWKRINQPIEGFNYSKILTLEGSKDRKLLITDVKKALINTT